MTASASSEVAELRARLEKSEATRAKLRASLIALKVRPLATRATTLSPPPPPDAAPARRVTPPRKSASPAGASNPTHPTTRSPPRR